MKSKMKRKLNFKIANVLLAICLMSFAITSCKDDANDDNTTTTTNTAGLASNQAIAECGDTCVVIVDSIVGTRTLSADTTYLLKGFVYVINGATLNIPAGTIIKGQKSTMGSLIVERGGKINATGTAANPIIFTSEMKAGYRAWSDWGGVILCGKAPVNSSDPQIEGGPRTHYGGTVSNDNSGTMTYVRIEFAGYPFQTDKEINGLTFGGVGSGTTINHICVAYSGDDSYEWFGGTVNCDHLVALYGQDDDFDTDNGYSGHCQFLYGVRLYSKADVSNSNGFESDNDASGSTNEPITKAVFANVTLCGPYDTLKTANVSSDYRRGAHLRRHTHLKIYNSVIAGWPYGIYVDGTTGTSTVTDAANDSLVLKNCYVVGCATDTFQFAADADKATIRAWFTRGGNTYLKTTDQAGIRGSFLSKTTKSGSSYSTTGTFRNLTTCPQTYNGTASPLLSGGYSGLTSISSFFTNTSYIGAFSTDDWTSGWVEYNPQQAVY
jgi:hypothetical protein